MNDFACDWKRKVTNGAYQEIFWLGVGGYVIVNKPAKEIVLLDPWPTYDKGAKNSNSKLQALANFLRQGLAEDYKITGVLLSHDHFDHINDIPCLFELLLLNTGTVKNHFRNEFKLQGKKLSLATLPPIFCDYDTKRRLQKRFAERYYDEDEMGGFGDEYTSKLWKKIREHYSNSETRGCWEEITDKTGRRLRYNDSYNARLPWNQRLVAGTQTQKLKVGSFDIQPYIWDHYNVPAGWLKSLPGQMSGNLQRQSAFLVSGGAAGQAGTNAKRTFISGSSGEMTPKYTGPVKDIKPPLKVDVLIQAICNSGQRLDGMVSYQKRCIEVVSSIVPSHWEDFIAVQGGAASKKEFKGDNFEKVIGYHKALGNKTLRDKVLVLGRASHEFKMASKPSKL